MANGDLEHPWAWSSGGTPLTPGAHPAVVAQGDITGEAPTATDPDRLLGSLTWTTGGAPITPGSTTAPQGQGDFPLSYYDQLQAWASGGTPLTPGAHAAPAAQGDIVGDYQGAEQHDGLPSGWATWASGGTPLTPGSHSPPAGQGGITGDYAPNEEWAGIYTWASGGPKIGIENVITDWQTTNATFYATIATDGNGKVMVGSNIVGKAWLSTDGGVTFSLSPIVPNSNASDSIAYGNGVWMYHYPGLVAVSSDAVNWLRANTTPVDTGQSWSLATNGKGLWVTAVNNPDHFVPYYSTNAAQLWTAATNVPSFTVVNTCWSYLIYDGAVFAMVNANNCIFTSPDGNTWTSYSFGSDGLYSLAGKAALGICAAAVTQTNNLRPALIRVASSWASLVSAPNLTVPFANGDYSIQTIAIDAQGKIVAVGNYGSVATSVNMGQTWIEDSPPYPHTGLTGNNLTQASAVAANVIWFTMTSTLAAYTGMVVRWQDGLNKTTVGQGDIPNPYGWEDQNGTIPPAEYQTPGVP